MRDRRIHPSRQRTYRYLHVRVDRLEDAISYLYNVTNELRRHVSTLEKQLKPLAGDLPGSHGAPDNGAVGGRPGLVARSDDEIVQAIAQRPERQFNVDLHQNPTFTLPANLACVGRQSYVPALAPPWRGFF